MKSSPRKGSLSKKVSYTHYSSPTVPIDVFVSAKSVECTVLSTARGIIGKLSMFSSNF